jgi:beta-glucanase (GH16 family)
MMKKRSSSVVIALATIFIASFFQIANGSVVSGTPCPNIGKVKIDSGKKYFCVSRNNSLVWNKGVNWVAPKPASSPSPTKSPNVVPSSPAAEIVKINDRKVGALIWNEEFDPAPTLNSKIWTARYCGHAASNGGGTCHNNESQYFLPEAVALDKSGNAVITTKYITTKPSVGSCLGDKCAFTSGRFDTQEKVSFLYGYIEARIKFPVGSGNWPAFWMLGSNITSIGWPNSGEIDIAEGFGNAKTKTSSAVHYSTTGSGCCDNHLYDYIKYDIGQDYSADFHTYGVAWLPNEISFYVDRKLTFRTSSSTIRSKFWPFNTPNFLILNNAVTYGNGFGGAWNGWQSSEMLIDYVRHYELDGQGKVFQK